MSRALRARGFTLIELVMVLAIFALVALMGVEGLSGMIRMRGRLAEIDSATAEMTLTLSLLRQDMKAVVPVAFIPSGGGAPRSAFVAAAGGTALELSVAGRPAFPGAEDGPREGRVTWRLDPATGQLTRQAWPVLQPASATRQEPAVVCLSGVSALQVRSYTPAAGWVDGDGVPPGQQSYSTTLPAAYEVWLTTRRFGKLRVLVALR